MDYVKVKIKDFNINDITFTKKDDKTYNIKYQNNNFYLIPNNKFRTYMKIITYMKKFVLILDEDDNSESFKNVINQIHFKFNTYYYKNNSSTIENVNPLGPQQCTLDIDVRSNISRLYKVEENNEINLFNIEDVQQQMRFTIYPIIYISNITFSKGKLYTNYILHEAYVRFDKPILDKSDILKIFKN